MRLDQYLAYHRPEYSRSVWQKFIDDGLVTVNGKVVRSNTHTVKDSDSVEATTPDSTDFSKEKLPIIYEDDHVLVIDKPTGLLTHAKGAYHDEFTLADFVYSRMTTPEDTNRPGIVHRLDRDTSGVIIAAKDTESKRMLQKQFQDRRAKKTYLAVLTGTPKLPEATIDIPILRNPKKPSTFRPDPKGKSAQTHYRVVAKNDRFSLVELKPVTGRTHQLRVHMAHIGTPILGDSVYGNTSSKYTRLYLHAHSLEITIPGSKRMTFTSSSPKEFQELVTVS